MDIEQFLIKNHFGCILLESNEDIDRILKSISGEKGIAVVTKRKIDIQDDNVRYIFSEDMIEDFSTFFSDFSTIYIHNFQKMDHYTREMIREWFERYTNKKSDIPYLLLSSFSEYYNEIPLPLKKNNAIINDRKKVDIEYMENYFPACSDEKYQELSEKIKKDFDSDIFRRSMVIVPDEKRQDTMIKLLKKVKKLTVIKERYPFSKFLEHQIDHSNSIVFVITDNTDIPYFFPDIDIVYDSSEIVRLVRSRTSMNRKMIQIVNVREMETRMRAYGQEKYFISLPRKVVMNLEKTTKYIQNCDVDDLYLIDKKFSIEPSMEMKIFNTVVRDEKGHWKVTKLGKICMNLDIPISHSTFLIKCMEKKSLVDIFFVTVLVTVFCCTDLIDDKPDVTPWNLLAYISLYFGGDREFFKYDQKIIDMIKELSEIFGISESIYNLKKCWIEVLPLIKEHYKHKTVKYYAGHWEDSKGKKYTLPNISQISKIILPIENWKNQKGEYFISRYIGIDDPEHQHVSLE
jgi:hypothetical protein